MHEAQMHEYNSFITLTYDTPNLPTDYSVDMRVWQLFAKRLRKEIITKIRYFACGEYGEKNLRPHYHALIFGYAFPDREFYSTTTGGHRQFISAQLQKAWPYGRATIGNVTYSSAAYCCGYTMKKIGGPPAADHYRRIHPLTNQVVEVKPEFAVQSRRPGIGATWFDKYKEDCFPSDFIVVDGRQKPVPRYYTLKLKEDERQALDKSRARKQHQSIEYFRAQKDNRSKDRLSIRQEIKSQNLARSKRGSLKDDDQ